MKTTSDLKPFQHAEEGTHYACNEMVAEYGTKVKCCGCTNHSCGNNPLGKLIPVGPSFLLWKETAQLIIGVILGFIAGCLVALFWIYFL